MLGVKVKIAVGTIILALNVASKLPLTQSLHFLMKHHLAVDDGTKHQNMAATVFCKVCSL